jgi:ABC-type proline/glycine betaine transport system ATPase subunit
MSGTQDENFAVKNSEELTQSVQVGLEENANESAQEVESDEQEKLSPSQKMDELIRGSSKGFMKKEIEKLRKEDRGSFAVVDDDKKLIGYVSKSDIANMGMGDTAVSDDLL